MVEMKHLLKTIQFKNIEQWDAKSLFGTSISSKYKVERLGRYIERNTKKVKLFNYPETEFHILGISNETGMFDAYSELGRNINQPYILVDYNEIAYNPYRINVGSIGLKQKR